MGFLGVVVPSPAQLVGGVVSPAAEQRRGRPCTRQCEFLMKLLPLTETSLLPLFEPPWLAGRRAAVPFHDE